jgi:hypothetical protein
MFNIFIISFIFSYILYIFELEEMRFVSVIIVNSNNNNNIIISHGNGNGSNSWTYLNEIFP